MIPVTFVDTNVLMRPFDEGSDLQEPSRKCLRILSKESRPFILMQNLAEFWHGFVSEKESELRKHVEEEKVTKDEASEILSAFKEEIFHSLLETLEWVQLLEFDREPVLDWLRLLKTHKLRARDVHDARLVAAMIDNNIRYMVSFDEDFKRYKNIIWLTPFQVIERFG